MDPDRRQRYLETLLQGRAKGTIKELIPVVNRWNEILGSIPGLQRRHPGAHCRVAGFSGGVLVVEADHPAWLQLLQWHQAALVEHLNRAFPVLRVRALQFRLTRSGDPVERPTTVMPEPVKPQLTEAEQSQLEALLAELESLIQKKPQRPENTG